MHFQTWLKFTGTSYDHITSLTGVGLGMKSCLFGSFLGKPRLRSGPEQNLTIASAVGLLLRTGHAFLVSYPTSQSTQKNRKTSYFNT